MFRQASIRNPDRPSVFTPAIRVPDGAVLLVTLRADLPGDLSSAVWPPRFESRNPNSAYFKRRLRSLNRSDFTTARSECSCGGGCPYLLAPPNGSRLTAWSTHDGAGAGRRRGTAGTDGGGGRRRAGRQRCQPGHALRTARGVVTAIDDIPAGHKVAVRPIAAGAPVHKYGEVIGIAREDILPGAHVHSHNLGVGSAPLTVLLALPSASRRPGHRRPHHASPFLRLPPPRRSGGNTQLRRGTADRQLLGDGRPDDRGQAANTGTPVYPGWTESSR